MTKNLRLIESILLIALITLVAIGCATPQGTPDHDPVAARIHSVSKLASYSGARIQLLRDPDSRAELERIRQGVNELAAQDKWDTAALVIVIGGNFSELQSDEGTLILTTVPMFIDLFTGAQWDLRDSRYAEAVITGVAGGLNLALGPVPDISRSWPMVSYPASPPAHGVLEKLQSEARSTR